MRAFERNSITALIGAYSGVRLRTNWDAFYINLQLENISERVYLKKDQTIKHEAGQNLV